MDRNYYYFAASLPMVFFDSEPPFSLEDFLADCERLLHEEDYQLIKELLLESGFSTKTRSPIFNQFSAFAQKFMNEQAVFRAQTAGKDPLDYIRGEWLSDPYHKDVLLKAQKAENPLEAQRTVDRFRRSPERSNNSSHG